MEALVLSMFAVAIAEIGDKTQLLSLVLAARYRRPWAICFGILLATLTNHALAAWLGTLIAHWFKPELLRWMMALSFLVVAAWTLVPDEFDEQNTLLVSGRSVFTATLVAFFVAEIGDKTQVATVVLAVQHASIWAVVVGTTIGMMIANVPVVLLGSRLAERLPLPTARAAAALVFAVMGLWILLR